MEKSNKSQKPSPQKPTISIGELSVKINPIINTTKVNIIANKNASGKYFCTILSKKRVTAFNMISPHHFQYVIFLNFMSRCHLIGMRHHFYLLLIVVATSLLSSLIHSSKPPENKATL